MEPSPRCTGDRLDRRSPTIRSADRPTLSIGPTPTRAEGKSTPTEVERKSTGPKLARAPNTVAALP